MITFIEIFPELERELIKYKVHFAIGTSDNDPLHAFWETFVFVLEVNVRD